MADLTGLGSVANFATGIIDRIFPKSASAEEKLAASVELEKTLSERENAVVQAKAAVMVAELNQDDKYTKRGRPTVIYGGLAIIFVNHALFPILSWFMLALAALFADAEKLARIPELPTLTLPIEFWVAWGTVLSIYSVGRSQEKSGNTPSGIMGGIYNLIAGKAK